MEDKSQQSTEKTLSKIAAHHYRDSNLYPFVKAALAAIKEKLGKGDYAAVTSEAKALADWAKEVARQAR
jgi:hypothetical protein